MAVSHSLIAIVCAILALSTTFTDLGITYFDERDRAQVRRRLTGRLETLGYQVSVSPVAASYTRGTSVDGVSDCTRCVQVSHPQSMRLAYSSAIGRRA